MLFEHWRQLMHAPKLFGISNFFVRRTAMLDYAFRTALRPVGLFLPEFAHVAAQFVCDSGPSCSISCSIFFHTIYLNPLPAYNF